MRFSEVTKRDFIAIAAILCEHGAGGGVADSLGRYFKSQNARFDEARFKRAATTCERGDSSLRGYRRRRRGHR